MKTSRFTTGQIIGAAARRSRIRGSGASLGSQQRAQQSSFPRERRGSQSGHGGLAAHPSEPEHPPARAPASRKAVMHKAKAFFFVCAGLFCLAGVLLPVAAWCQPPAVLRWWWVPRPMGIAFDSAGDIYVAEFANHHIDVHAPDGTRLAQWGADGGDTSSVTGPGYLAADANGHLFIAEWIIHNPNQSPAQEFTTAGAFIARVGYYSANISSAPGAIGSIGGIAVDAAGRIYVTDLQPRRTQVFTNDRVFLFAWPSTGNSIAIDALGHAFEIDDACVVTKYDIASGAELTHWGSCGSGPGQFNSAQGIAADAAGNVYVTDTYNHRVEVFDNNGAFLMQWGGYGSAPGQFYRPMGIGVGPDGKIYVGDTWNGRVQVFARLPRDVRVDVRPGDDNDVVNPGANGVLPVAILSESDFDATTVDPLSVQLAGASVRVRPHGEPMAWSRDVDGDGRADLLLHIEAGELALAPGDTVAQLTGLAPNQQVVRGAARMRVVGGGRGPSKPRAQPLTSAARTTPSLLGARILPDGRVLASVRLTAEGPARLDLIDLAGRRLDTLHLEDGSVDGRDYSLGRGGLAPGVYWVRLEQAGRVSTARVAAVR